MAERRMVVVCYSHDSEPHSERVRQLADLLRQVGVNTQLDQYMEPAGPSTGWRRWIDGLHEVDAILAVCSPIFQRRVDAAEDGALDADQAREIERLMAELVVEPWEGTPVLPVLLDTADPKEVLPRALQGEPVFRLPGDFEALCRRIGQGNGDPVPVDDKVMPADDVPEHLKTNWRDGRRG